MFMYLTTAHEPTRITYPRPIISTGVRLSATDIIQRHKFAAQPPHTWLAPRTISYVSYTHATADASVRLGIWANLEYS